MGREEDQVLKSSTKEKMEERAELRDERANI